MSDFGFLLRCSRHTSSEQEKKTSAVCKLSPEFVAGRAPGASLLIPHFTISKVHCLFTYNPEYRQWTISDKSHLGTWLNDRRLPHGEEVPLKFSDYIRFGPTYKFIYKFRSYHSDGGSSSTVDFPHSTSVQSVSSSSATTSSLSGSSEMDVWSISPVNSSAVSTSGSSAEHVGSVADGRASPTSSTQQPISLKRTLSEKSSPPFKRKCQSTPTDTTQNKELTILTNKEAFLESQLLVQLDILHHEFKSKRDPLIKEQQRLAQSLEEIGNEEREKERELRNAHSAKVKNVRREIDSLRIQKSADQSSRPSSPAPSTSSAADSTDTSVPGTYHDTVMKDLHQLQQQVLALKGDVQRCTEIERSLQRQLEVSERERAVLLQQLNVVRGIPLTDDHIGRLQGRETMEDNAARELESGVGEDNLTSTSLLSEHAGQSGQSSDNHGHVDSDSPAPSASVELPEDLSTTQESPAEHQEEQRSPASEEESDSANKEPENPAMTKLKEIGNLMEEELQCSICNELLVSAVTINCAHSFCKFCLGEWKKHRPECPMCRQSITAEHRSVILDSLINSVLGQLNPEVQQRHQEVMTERAAVEAERAAAANATPSGSRHSHVPGTSQGSNQSEGAHQPRGPRQYMYHHNINFPPHHWHNNPMSIPPPQPSSIPMAHMSHHNGPPPSHPAHPPPAHLPNYHNMHHHHHHHHPPPHPPQSHIQGSGSPGPMRHENSPPRSPESHASEIARIRRRNARNMISENSSTSSSDDHSDSQGSYASAHSYSSAPDRISWYDAEYAGQEFEDENVNEREYVPGIPGRFYGGGVCFYCNQRGHWIRGCPVRFGRH